MPHKDKPQRNEYQRKWVAKRRAAWFTDKFCIACKSTQDLELDHVDPALKINHRIFSWSSDRREEELAKCQVLCHDCHLQKSLSLYPPRQHGTKTMYDKDKCRCDLCRKANAESWMRYYNARKLKVLAESQVL